MNLPKIFMYQDKEIRTVLIDNDPWWVAKDVCEIFGDTNYRRSVARLDEDEKGVSPLSTPGGRQEITVVNESGLYALLFNMQPQKKTGMDDAQYENRVLALKNFKRWITHEVIPSIRKHGAYMTPDTIEKTLTDPDFIIGLASRLKQANEERIQLAAKIEADKPLVLFAESLQVSKDSILVADLAKLLKQNGINIGERRLFERLRSEGYLIKSGSEYNMPTQRSMDLKVMEIKIGYRGSSDGTTKITRTPKITGKGQVYFINKFKGTMQAG